MESLKILLTNTFYPPYHVGGDATHVQQLASLLAKEGHEVYVTFSIDAYLAKQYRSNLKKILPYEKQDQVVIYPLRSPYSFFEPIRAYSLGYSNWITKKLAGILKIIKPEVIHHHNYSLLGNKIFKLNRGIDVSILTLHDYYPICQQHALFKFGRNICTSPECFKCSFFIRRPYQFWRKTSLKHAFLNNDYIISPSQFLKDMILERSHFEDVFHKKFEVLSNFFIPVKIVQKEDYLRDFGEYFVFSGKITYIKGIHKLVKSFVRFSQEFPDINLVVTGRGDLFRNLRKIVDTHKINRNIHFLGKTDYSMNLQIIKHAKGLILPSVWYENCPMTLIESIFLKTIPIATDLGGMREILIKLSKKLLINPQKFETSLFKIMRSVIRGEINIPDNIFEKIFNQNYSTSAFLEKYNEILKKAK